MVQGIFREAAISGHAAGSVAFRLIAIIQTGCIFTNQTIVAATTAMVRLNCHAVPDGKLVHALA